MALFDNGITQRKLDIMSIEQYVSTGRMTLAAIAQFYEDCNPGGEERTHLEINPDPMFGDIWAMGLTVRGRFQTSTTWVVIVNPTKGTVQFERSIVEQEDGEEYPSAFLDITRNTPVPLSSFTPERFGEIICETILGFSYIPLVSRKSARDLETHARSVADLVFREGMQRILRLGAQGDGWSSSTNGERWEVIQEHAVSSLGYNPVMRRVVGDISVPLFSFNVWQEAFTQRAYENMESIYMEHA